MPVTVTDQDWQRLKAAFADEYAMRIVYERVIAEQTAEIARLKALVPPAADREGGDG